MRNKYLYTMLFCITFVLSGQAQQTVNGLVTSNGEPLPGVNVIEKGTTNGVSTDFDGNYSITVANDTSILILSYLGFESKEVSVNGQSSINVSLQESAESLEEVVVVGFGTQKKKDLTGAIETLGSDDITRTPTTSLDQALGGQVAGVFIAGRGGDAAAPINVRIRGVGTTGNNQPLFVVDGIPLVQTSNQTVNTGSNTESNPLSTLNPNDIESINVLKDASAAAIYGARAANGVVIITTKRGKKGATKVNYDFYTTVANSRAEYDVLNTEEYIEYQGLLGNDFSEFSGSPTYDWQDAVTQTGFTQNHNVGVSGGSENINFSVTAGYIDQKGIQLAQNFERYSFSANSDFKVGKRFKFGESLSIGITDRLVQSEPGAQAFSRAAVNAPFLPIFDANDPLGYSVLTSDVAGDLVFNNAANQIVAVNDLANNETRVKTNRVLASIYGEVEIAKGLKYRYTAGLDYTVGENQWFQNIYNYGEAGGSFNGTNLLVKERPIEKTVNISNILTYDAVFGKHNLSFLIGHEETDFVFTKLRAQATDLLNPSVKFVNTGDSAANEEADHWALRGYLGRVNYNFDSKYLLTFNLRRDATSRFSPENRADYFPSFALGWRASEESFLIDSDGITNLKFRASWGQAGNQFTGANFAYLSQLIFTPAYVIGDDQTVTIAPTSIVFANPDLKWEKSNQTNVGFDLSLFSSKLDLTFDYYKKLTKDILVSIPFPTVTGFALPTDVNLGEVVNTGVEVSANYSNKIGEDFTYGLSANFSSLKNEVLDLGDNTLLSGAFGNTVSRTIVGEPIGHFYGYKTDGLYQTDAEAAQALPDDAAFGEVGAGDLRFVDVNGDGEITPEDRTKIGSAIPTFYYGFTLSAGYKNFDATIFLQGVGGNDIYNQTRQTFESMIGQTNQFASIANRWTGEGTSNSFPRLDPTNANNNTRFSDRFVEDGSYARLKNIQLGYTFDSEKLSKMSNGFISSLRLYVAGQNLAVFTNYSGLDPEVTRAFSFQKGETALSTGIDDGYAPPAPTTFQIGARVSF